MKNKLTKEEPLTRASIIARFIHRELEEPEEYQDDDFLFQCMDYLEKLYSISGVHTVTEEDIKRVNVKIHEFGADLN